MKRQSEIADMPKYAALKAIISNTIKSLIKVAPNPKMKCLYHVEFEYVFDIPIQHETNVLPGNPVPISTIHTVSNKDRNIVLAGKSSILHGSGSYLVSICIQYLPISVPNFRQISRLVLEIKKKEDYDNIYLPHFAVCILYVEDMCLQNTFFPSSRV